MPTKRVVKSTEFEFDLFDGSKTVSLVIANDHENVCTLTIDGTEYGMSNADALDMPKAFRLLNKESGRFVSSPRAAATDDSK